MNNRILITVFFVLASVSCSFGQSFSAMSWIDRNDKLGLISYVKLRPSDQVTKNCWTNEAQITSNIRLKFEQNGVETLQYKPASATLVSPYVNISVLGFRAGGICAGTATFGVFYLYSAKYGGLEGSKSYGITGVASLFERSKLMTNGTNLNSQLAAFFDGASSELIADILSARRKKLIVEFKAELPRLFDKPMSNAEYQKLLKKYQ